MKKFEILDCTLRDGGYYNNWNFNLGLIQNYLNSLNSTKIKFIELGARSKNLNEKSNPDWS